MEPLIAYTDGSGTVAHLPCGAGVVVFDGDLAVIEVSRPLGLGTNNRAELCAVGLALYVTPRARPLVVRSDSEYVIGALTGPRDTPVGRPNADTINYIRRSMRGRAVTFEWVKGHSGIAGNERADELAGRARRCQPIVAVAV